MAFSEEIKRQVKENSAFRCCRCQNIGIEVHHIIPEAAGGPDSIENAAPLCPSCHAGFGANAQKRKETTQMRDWWYRQVDKKYPHSDTQLKVLEEINSKLENVREQTSSIDELKVMLKTISNDTIDRMTPDNAVVAASGILNTSSAASSVRLGDRVHANVVCSNCNTRIGLLVGANECPNCGTPLG